MFSDTENIRFVFAAVKDTILQLNLKEYNLVQFIMYKQRRKRSFRQCPSLKKLGFIVFLYILKYTQSGGIDQNQIYTIKELNFFSHFVPPEVEKKNIFLRKLKRYDVDRQTDRQKKNLLTFLWMEIEGEKGRKKRKNVRRAKKAIFVLRKLLLSGMSRVRRMK